MRNIVAQIFSSNWETYKEFYKNAVVMAYAKDFIEISRDSISYKLIHLEGSTIQSQRAPSSIHSRTISVYEDGNLRYIIGISNTGYDEDKRIEVQTQGGKYKYGNSDWHSNTFLCQGINKIFSLYYKEKVNNSNLKLFFYLLDNIIGRETVIREKQLLIEKILL